MHRAEKPHAICHELPNALYFQPILLAVKDKTTLSSSKSLQKDIWRLQTFAEEDNIASPAMSSGSSSKGSRFSQNFLRTNRTFGIAVALSFVFFYFGLHRFHKLFNITMAHLFLHGCIHFPAQWLMQCKRRMCCRNAPCNKRIDGVTVTTFVHFNCRLVFAFVISKFPVAHVETWDTSSVNCGSDVAWVNSTSGAGCSWWGYCIVKIQGMRKLCRSSPLDVCKAKILKYRSSCRPICIEQWWFILRMLNMGHPPDVENQTCHNLTQ